MEHSTQFNQNDKCHQDVIILSSSGDNKNISLFDYQAILSNDLYDELGISNYYMSKRSNIIFVDIDNEMKD